MLLLEIMPTSWSPHVVNRLRTNIQRPSGLSHILNSPPRAKMTFFPYLRRRICSVFTKATKKSYKFLQQLVWGSLMDLSGGGRWYHHHREPVGQTNRTAAVLSAYLQSACQSRKPWGKVALPRSSAVTTPRLSSTAGFSSLSLSKKLLVYPFQAVGMRAGETTKHKHAAQSSVVHQREQRQQLTWKEIHGWDWSTEVRTFDMGQLHKRLPQLLLSHAGD